MLLSIFTPTHNTDYLKELHESILAQTYENWEWIIVLNSGAKKPKYIKDKRVKVFNFKGTPKGVGELKKYACNLCTGEYLIEVDHDDVIRVDALERIQEVTIHQMPDFMYSDFLEFKGGESNVYDSKFGWETIETEFQGKKHTAMIAFDVDPASLSSIHHAPNHIRVWNRNFYNKIGGHNPDLVVCDDYDLIVRTYLAGGIFVHIPHCLYYYRLREDEGNTYLVHNKSIQMKQKEISRDNLEALVSEWCERTSLEKIDLGGAHNSPDGYVSIDLQGADINHDLSKGLPFNDNSIGCIRAFDFLEHIPKCTDSLCTHQKGQCAIGMMKEIYRVLVPNGWLLSATPSTGGRGAFQDQTHACYSEDTEVLTVEGWRLLKDVGVGESVLTIDIETQDAEYQKVSQKNSYLFDGKMVHFKTRSMDLMVTPNHKMISKSSGTNTKYKFREASEYVGLSNKSNIFPNKVNISSDGRFDEDIITLPSNDLDGYGWGQNKQYDSKLFMTLLGWFLSEGSTAYRCEEGNGRYNFYRVSISQSRSASYDKYLDIVKLIEDLGLNPIKQDTSISFNNKPLCLFLRSLGHSAGSKYIPVWIKQSSPRLLKILLTSLIAGDGTPNGATGYTYSSISRTLANDVCEISQMCGYRATMSIDKREKYMNIMGRTCYCRDLYLIYISKQEGQYACGKERYYKGTVYCLGVDKYHTLFVRRNGRASWSGNSFWNPNSFWYFTKAEQSKYYRSCKVRFIANDIREEYPSEFYAAHEILYVYANLIAIKDKRVAGLREI